MLLYNLIFPREGICEEKELYCRGGEYIDGGLYLKADEEVTFDTYFNCFSHIKYKKYTDIKTVCFALKLRGKGVLSICLYRKNGESEILVEEYADGDIELKFDISGIADEGFLYPLFKATEDTVIEGGEYCAEAEPRKVEIAVVICTYKREKYLKRNVEALKEFRNKLQENKFFDVLIVDNGRTVNEDFGEGFTVFPNDNTGGSGGFTRGMREAYARNKYTHFLLMDDDIVFDTQVLTRTASLISVLKEEYKTATVGGAMLVLDRPYLQEEMGADWDGIMIKSHRKRVDVRKQEEIYLNEINGEADYNGWFFTCMPMDTVEKYGYPLPIFIKCDDIEYGLRATEGIISSSGIAIWHEDFEAKSSLETEYYIKRNELIVNSRFPKGKGIYRNWKKLVLSVGKQIAMQRYFVADLLFKAYDDFFKGPQFVFNLDSAEYHKELKNLCPQLLSEEEIEKNYGLTLDYAEMDGEFRKKRFIRQIITLNGYLIPKCFYKKRTAQVDMTRCKYVDFFMKKRVLQFNRASGRGYVSEMKNSALIKYGFKLIIYYFKLLFGYKKTAKLFAAAEIK